MKRGLIIGKFYPFHAGHAHLISTAEKRCDRLVVLVCDRSDQVFNGEERAAWIREAFPSIEVLVIRDIFHDDDSRLWAEYTRAFLGYAPDIVFTSEDYGDAYASFLGAKHILVDKARSTVPISGTLIRSNPYGSWGFLSDSVRAALARRVALVGPGSTGKTTLAKALAEHYETVWVPEFARLYIEGKLTSSMDWKDEEFVCIARVQNAMEDTLARRAQRILFSDTNAWTTRLWHGVYQETKCVSLDELVSDRQYDMVFLMDDDIPFVSDGLRDSERLHRSTTAYFAEQLNRDGIAYTVLSGSSEERKRRAIEACESLLASGKDIFESFPRQGKQKLGSVLI